MIQIFKRTSLWLLLIITSWHLASCLNTKKVVYMNDLSETTAGNLGVAKTNFENLIQKNDQLWISVGGSNPLDLVSINSANGSGGSSTGITASTGAAIGYLVEADGNIKLPYAGMVKAAGLTRLQLEASLTELFKDFTKNPVVNVRFLNYSFSIMGEVNNKGRYNMLNERATILDALSMAGDLTELGKRDNILVVRELDGKRNFGRVNILSSDLFKSPYYYLKNNDVVYVEPVKAKFISRTGVPQYLSILAVGLSLLITIINLKK